MKTLYIHIPFCSAKCFYCSFVVCIGQEKRIGSYLEGLEREAQLYKGEEIQSVYIGGGTPTVMGSDELKEIFNIIRTYFDVTPGAEWTIEANPEGLDHLRLTLLKEEGVNRISLGVQSLNDKYLKYLGRAHDVSMARAAFDRIKSAGFNNINVDLMFAFPDQTSSELKKDIEDVLALGSDHLSLYTLMVEEHSRFYARNIQLEDGQYQAEQYSLVCDKLNAAGFAQYEISNFAKPSKASKHNCHYWQGGEYIGLGVGAHSYIDGKRFWNTSRLNDYIAFMQKGVSAQEGSEALTLFDQMKEAVLFGLRMNRGVSIEQIKKRFGCFFNDAQKEKVDCFIGNGFLIEEDGYLKATSKGRLVLDELCAQLI
ncbi:MAG: radical SAM family heme chaperone HemW [Candidatus Omnitrophica bacterium]|nr:radical SAM family heme chaperone HemW [Candidatus Omnitrophota bacterium]